jgi:HEAT repeat protein
VPDGPGGLDDGEIVSSARFPALASVVALMAQGELLQALDELSVLLQSDDANLRPRAVLLLARINEAGGNTAQMLHAYEVAAASGHPEVAPFAAAILGGKLLELGQPKPARRALRQAARAPDPQVREAAQATLDALSTARPRRPWRLFGPRTH